MGSEPSPRLSQPCHGESSQCSDMSSYEEALSPASVASSGAQRLQKERGVDHGENHSRELPLLTQHFMSSDPAKWNVEDVYEFICSLPGRVWYSRGGVACQSEHVSQKVFFFYLCVVRTKMML